MRSRSVCLSASLTKSLFLCLLGFCLHASAEVGPFVLSVEGGKTRVLQFDANSKKPTILFEEPGLTFKTIVISLDGEYLAIRDAQDTDILLHDLKKKTKQRVPGTKNGIPGFFVKGKPWLVYYLEPPAVVAASPHPNRRASKVRKLSVEVVDFEKKCPVRPLVGSYAHPSIKDDSVYLLKQGGEVAQIFRFIPGKKPTPKVADVALDGIEVASINELHGIDKSKFIYQTTGEHDIRYYWDDGKPLFIGDARAAGKPADKTPDPATANAADRPADKAPAKAPESTADKSKEQLDLALSQDGKLAAFTERNPNELSYLVVLDLSEPQDPAKKIKTTEVYGSFPHIANGLVYFLSDPAFLKAKKPEFQQIENYVLYVYDPATGKVNEVHRFAGQAGLL